MQRLATARDDGAASTSDAGANGGAVRLVAYWTGDDAGGDASDAIRAYLRERLPEQMIPDRIVHLERMPRTGTGKVQNANSTYLNGRDFHDDLESALNRPVRLANDANCFALSEAADGAAAGAATVFGVIAASSASASPKGMILKPGVKGA